MSSWIIELTGTIDPLVEGQKLSHLNELLSRSGRYDHEAMVQANREDYRLRFLSALGVVLNEFQDVKDKAMMMDRSPHVEELNQQFFQLIADEVKRIQTPRVGLEPGKKYAKWTKEEHQDLQDGYEQFGIRYDKIINFPAFKFNLTRTIQSIKSQLSLVRKRKREENGFPKKKKKLIKEKVKKKTKSMQPPVIVPQKIPSLSKPTIPIFRGDIISDELYHEDPREEKPFILNNVKSSEQIIEDQNSDEDFFGSDSDGSDAYLSFS